MPLVESPLKTYACTIKATERMCRYCVHAQAFYIHCQVDCHPVAGCARTLRSMREGPAFTPESIVCILSQTLRDDLKLKMKEVDAKKRGTDVLLEEMGVQRSEAEAQQVEYLFNM